MHKEKPLFTTKYSTSIIFCLLFILLFAPLVSQYIIVHFQHHGISLTMRILVHIIIPIAVTSWIFKASIWQSFIKPLVPKNRELLLWSVKAGLLGGLAAIITIVGAFLVFQNLLDLDSIEASLNENFRVNKQTYPAIALAILLGTPFFEEYFWRGFIYRSFRSLASSTTAKYFYMIFTGFFFAVHHVVIVSNWFNWWQYLLSIVFLAIVGVLFNWMYEKTDSILASWITHFIADLVILLIGFHMFGFF